MNKKIALLAAACALAGCKARDTSNISDTAAGAIAPAAATRSDSAAATNGVTNTTTPAPAPPSDSAMKAMSDTAAKHNSTMRGHHARRDSSYHRGMSDSASTSSPTPPL